MFTQAYVHTAIELLETYKATEPFSSFIKKYFSLHKKFGSRDRKHIAHLCYCFFRLGKSLKNVSIHERLGIALFLCNEKPHDVLEYLNPELNAQATLSIVEKIQTVKEQYNFKEEEIFSLKDHASTEIDYQAFSLSFLVQPNTFLRIRPGNTKAVVKKLEEAKIDFHLLDDNIVVLPPSTKADTILLLNKEVVVQDVSSQKVLQPLMDNVKGKILKQAWDCCAASGGKSILLKDHFPNIALTVSDVRESILINLCKRFKDAGINECKSFMADLSSPSFKIANNFDIVICDAPCSGSGTWGRTPEQLYFFDEKKIDYYASLQKKILANAVKGLKPDGFLLYITCSVFKKENEEVVDFIQQQLSLHLVSQSYFKGYHQKGDTLFSALFTL